MIFDLLWRWESRFLVCGIKENSLSKSVFEEGVHSSVWSKEQRADGKKTRAGKEWKSLMEGMNESKAA